MNDFVAAAAACWMDETSTCLFDSILGVIVLDVRKYFILCQCTLLLELRAKLWMCNRKLDFDLY